MPPLVDTSNPTIASTSSTSTTTTTHTTHTTSSPSSKGAPRKFRLPIRVSTEPSFRKSKDYSSPEVAQRPRGKSISSQIPVPDNRRHSRTFSLKTPEEAPTNSQPPKRASIPRTWSSSPSPITASKLPQAKPFRLSQSPIPQSPPVPRSPTKEPDTKQPQQKPPPPLEMDTKSPSDTKTTPATRDPSMAPGNRDTMPPGYNPGNPPNKPMQHSGGPNGVGKGFGHLPNLPLPNLSGHGNGPVGNLLRGPVDDNGNLKAAALTVGIKLDLEAEVHLSARVRGDILIGLY